MQVQVGNYANFVGAHFWNFQDEALGISGQGEEEWQSNTGVDMDVLYRVGETRQVLSCSLFCPLSGKKLQEVKKGLHGYT